MPVTVTQVLEMKRRGEKITMLTAYDYSTARLIDEAGVPLILVGDSLGMVMLGYESTIPVTMDEMIHHTRAVTRGAKNALVIGDMPFMTYHTSEEDALRNAALSGENTIPYFIEAVKAYATVGEIMDIFREEYGEWVEPAV